MAQPRPASTYRHARRNAWRSLDPKVRPPWAEFNNEFTQFLNRRTKRRSLEKANAESNSGTAR